MIHLLRTQRAFHRRTRVAHRWPEVLPGGQAVLFTILRAGSADYNSAAIAVVRLDTGERRMLIEAGSYPRYMPSGHIIFVRAGTLLAMPFRSARHAPDGFSGRRR